MFQHVYEIILKLFIIIRGNIAFEFMQYKYQLQRLIKHLCCYRHMFYYCISLLNKIISETQWDIPYGPCFIDKNIIGRVSSEILCSQIKIENPRVKLQNCLPSTVSLLKATLNFIIQNNIFISILLINGDFWFIEKMFCYMWSGVFFCICY